MKTDEIRKKYISFFEKKGHSVFPSDSLVPKDDPTLLFTGAGMNQFKDMFLGKGTLDAKKATTCQKCIRTGDIENVGRTPMHHTFFEMLGNFSFGDYFKTEAIEMAWEFMLYEMKLPKERLSVSVFLDDEESYEIWQNRIGIPEERIYRFGEKENFWPASAPSEGPNGPCGPCSEIFYDRGDGVGCGRKECAPDCDCERFVEVWNLVFTQFDRREGGALSPLPNKNVDTGMGLERMASVIQGVSTNFEIDIFKPIIQNISEITEVKYDSQAEKGKLMNRIADHVRAVIFCISDGVLPGNEGRGYVQRRLLRRAVRDGLKLGKEECFLYKLVPAIADVMFEQYPEIKQRRENIARIIKNEEERFHETLFMGNKRLDELMEDLRDSGEKNLSGQDAFQLYDTFGFPFEMTKSILEENNLSVDEDGFEKKMQMQRERAKVSSQMTGSIFDEGPLSTLKETTKESIFLGYEQSEVEGRVIGLIINEQLVDSAKAGQNVHVVLDQTPFYAEAGGQIGDTGVIRTKSANVEITDTKKSNDIIVHIGKVVEGCIRQDENVSSVVDTERRGAIKRNHSATHMLHSILRRVLGQHAEQSGSFVSPERLRFDFHHFEGVKKDEIARIEELMNERVMENATVTTDQMALDQARKAGATALFGEKYGTNVRVVSIGDYSQELCGGIHVKNTGEIGIFKIISETSIAAGIRRIEAATGHEAIAWTRRKEQMLDSLCGLLDTQENMVVQRAEDLIRQLKELRKDVQKAKKDGMQKKSSDFISKAKDISGVKVVAEVVKGADADDLRKTVDSLKKSLGSVAIILGAVGNGRVTLIVSLSSDLVKKGLHAGNIAGDIAKIVGGGGGGRPDMAQAGGQLPDKIYEAIDLGLKILQKEIDYDS
ncbi:alanyl-tRNA synthase [Candidatus Scalindua japonica]|uniref:Alanine--tRNA ligase n=1 Tax=Candidatus Scalindua japonica TaxID=1284222 RepID=A0A286TYG3_9BACT|nr:alanine--tRNA ligase [Candidatus Scalindua japonica]GAX60906.1 alanyl-tRNA synthase [Candidatus Scalindua japonica]